MKIIIAGAGEVGVHLASMLSNELKDIYIIDKDPARLAKISSQLDVFTIEGDAKSMKILEEASVENCDLLLAVTSSEETNFFITVLGKKMGAKKTIARFNDVELLELNRKDLFTELGIDIVISPIELAAYEISRLVHQSAFTDDIEFENGKLVVFGISVDPESPLVNKTIATGILVHGEGGFKPIAVLRKNITIIPTSEETIRAKDIIYFIAKKESLDTVLSICKKSTEPVTDIMILGGSRIGVLASKLLQDEFKIMLIEKNLNKCNIIAGQLSKTLVLNMDGTDVASLEEEGLAQMDAFIALTEDSEMNIMTCLLAKSHGVRKTIARIENMEYIPLSQTLGIDTLINKKMIAAASIFKHVRKGRVKEVANLHGVEAEIIEFEIKKASLVTKKPIKKLSLPDKTNIIGVLRNEEITLPDGNFQIRENDKVIVFVSTASIPQIEKFFQ